MDSTWKDDNIWTTIVPGRKWKCDISTTSPITQPGKKNDESPIKSKKQCYHYHEFGHGSRTAYEPCLCPCCGDHHSVVWKDSGTLGPWSSTVIATSALRRATVGASVRAMLVQGLYSLSGKTSYRLVKSRSRTAAKVPVKFQSDW